MLPRVWVFCLGGCCVLFGGEGIFTLKFAAQIRTLHIVSRMMCLRFSVTGAAVVVRIIVQCYRDFSDCILFVF